MMQKMRQTLECCETWLGPEERRAAETQALAYLINLSTHYLWFLHGESNVHPVLKSYAPIIDELCCL